MADPLQACTAEGFVAEYAMSNRSRCKASKRKIAKDCLRIGKIIAGGDNPIAHGKEMAVWYLPEALFDSFHKGKEGEKRLESTDELTGYGDLKKVDQERLQTLIKGKRAAGSEQPSECIISHSFFSVLPPLPLQPNPQPHFTKTRTNFRADWMRSMRLQPIMRIPKVATASSGPSPSPVPALASGTVRLALIGEEGLVSEKQHQDEKAAEKFHAKMIKDKADKGYEYATKGGKRKAAAGAGDDEMAPAKKAKLGKKVTAKKKKEPAGGGGAKEEEEAKVEEAKAKVVPAAKPVDLAGGDVNKLPALRYTCEYAKSGKSYCKFSKAPNGSQLMIPQGDLRLGKVVKSPWCAGAGEETSLWYVPEALFRSFRMVRHSEAYNRLTSADDCEGFEDLKKADKERLQRLIDDEKEFQEGLAVVDNAAYLEHEKGTFWSIVVAGSSTRVRFGKLGEEGNVLEKEHANEMAAEAYKEEMVKKKKTGGYEEAKEVGGTAVEEG
jgi:predicted DNA-binding WGR domain protein